jgi:hypothetical protein
MREQSSHFNPFGTPIVPPKELTQLERFELLQKAAGSMQAGEIDRYIGAWIGQAFASHLETGEPLDKLLGIRPEPGCTLTVAELTRAARCRSLLLQLSVRAGGDSKAARILSGQDPCPSRAQPLVDAIKSLGGPTSRASITRARREGCGSATRADDAIYAGNHQIEKVTA